MSYAMQQKRRARRAFRGFGVDNVTCDPGEVFDLTAMTCVQAGSATTPISVTPGTVPTTPPSIPGRPASAPPTTAPGAQQASMLGGGTMSGALPWVLGAILLVGVVYVAKQSGER